jgi:DNA-directed RNA polymerase specialized sigma24 family protein
MTTTDIEPETPTARRSFDELYRTRYAPMVRLAYVIVDTQADAEHVVQDAFMALYHRYDDVLAPEAYLRTSVVNGARKVLRRRRVAWRNPIDPQSDAGLGFDHTFDAVRRLPAQQRVLIALRYEQQLSDSEIASTLGLPIGTVKSRIHRALGALRQELS